MPSLSKLVNQAQTHDARTFNGAVTNSTSQSALVDLFFIWGTLLWKNPNEYMSKWHEAYAENKELAMRLLFWMRDIRWWAGVRDAFNYIYHQLSGEDKEHYMKYISEYWRWKDVFELAALDWQIFWPFIIYTMLETPQEQLGLFYKWFPRKWEVFKNTCINLKWTPKKLRHRIVQGSHTVEQQMSAKQWSEIKYQSVPSKAFNKYKKAFERNDPDRFKAFIEHEPEKVHSATLYPADIVKNFPVNSGYYRGASITDAQLKLAQAQWDNLPNFITTDKTFLPVIDVSGSMFSWSSSYETGITPLMVAVSLGLYLAERNKSIFRDSYVTFSSIPKMKYLAWKDLYNKYISVVKDPDAWLNTNIQWVFNLILDTAIRSNLTQEDLPDYVIIISDMEFDNYDIGWRSTNFEVIKQKFEQSGYKMPNLIFWNANGRIWNVPVTINDQGVALVSWYSPAIMKSVLSSKVVTPYEVMMETLDNERYKNII